jgi:hypothetical protein
MSGPALFDVWQELAHGPSGSGMGPALATFAPGGKHESPGRVAVGRRGDSGTNARSARR